MAALSLTQASFVVQKLSEEIQWLEAHAGRAPEGVREELQAMAVVRRASQTAIENEVNNLVIDIPAEAQTMVSSRITVEQSIKRKKQR